MRILTVFLLLIFVREGFGQTDNHVLGVGKWSKEIGDEDHVLRGRLVVYDDRGDGADHARVYLELQHVFKGYWPDPLTVRYQVGAEHHKDRCLHFEVRDRRGQAVPQADYSERAVLGSEPHWITLPCDSTARLRADDYTTVSRPKPEGLIILMENGMWIIPPRHEPVYLSGTFTPPKGSRRNKNDDFVWRGTLVLPPVKIPVR